MLMVFATGFEKAGMVVAVNAATKAALRINDWIFMRDILPFENQVSRTASCCWLDAVDTQTKGE
jgi:hypothetical protein